MARAVKVCRVCGKEYEACRSANSAGGTFRWQEVSCSPECGAIYLERVIASRAGKAEKTDACHDSTSTASDTIEMFNMEYQMVEPRSIDAIVDTHTNEE